MEARRPRLPTVRRYFFSIEWLYWALSNYGSSLRRAFAVLLFALAIFGMLVSIPLKLICVPAVQACERGSEQMVRALWLLKISNTTVLQGLTHGWRVLEIAFRIFVVIQVALLGLALRNLKALSLRISANNTYVMTLAPSRWRELPYL
jgi:hypothetical protein